MLSNLEIIEFKKFLWPRPILAVLRIFFIKLFPNWTACSPITYNYSVYLLSWGICEDRSMGCSDWAKNGDCLTDPKFMLYFCELTCTRCVDTNTGNREISNKVNICDIAFMIPISQPQFLIDVAPCFVLWANRSLVGNLHNNGWRHSVLLS
jgi:hypothetical protein